MTSSLSPARPRPLVVVAALGAALALAGNAAAATVRVHLTRGDRLQIVERAAPSGADQARAAANALFAGPTAAERRDGIGTAIPRGVAIRDLVVTGGVAFLRVDEGFAAGGSGVAVDLRMAQVVRTLNGRSGIRGVRVLLGDEPMPAAGEDPGAVLTPGAVASFEIIGPVPVTVRQVQSRLIALRYLPRGAATGRLDYRTSQALLAFQAWEGLGRTGTTDLATRRRLNAARIPVPRVASASRRIEITRSKGVALLIDDGAVRRAIHVSTGAGGATPRGTFRIIRKERMSWSRPFSVWLPFASYFVGGYAFHQYPHVPAYPASHGCVRIGAPEAPVVYAFASMGTVVQVT